MGVAGHTDRRVGYFKNLKPLTHTKSHEQNKSTNEDKEHEKDKEHEQILTHVFNNFS